jgi:peroxiredoxin
VKAQVIAISTDDLATQKEFKEKLGADYAFIADAKGVLTKLYKTKMPLLNIASRKTFVVGQDRKIKAIYSGSEAMDPGLALGACTLPAKP